MIVPRAIAFTFSLSLHALYSVLCTYYICIIYSVLYVRFLYLTGLDPSMSNNHNCTVIHYFDGRLCYQVKDQPSAGTGIWNAGNLSMLMFESSIAILIFLNMYCIITSFKTHKKFNSMSKLLHGRVHLNDNVV